MTKKDKILRIFNESEWLPPDADGLRHKTLTYDDFKKENLDMTIESHGGYSDIIYAKRIFKKMGYRVLICTGFHVCEQRCFII